jgi:hypothetical protein
MSYMGHNRINRVRTGHGSQAVGSFNLSPVQHILGQAFSFDGTPPKIGRQVVKSSRLYIKHNHLISFLVQAMG